MLLPLAILALGGASRAALAARDARSQGRGGAVPLNERRAACSKLCSKYAGGGTDERECRVECRVRTDLATSHAERALRNFADRQLGAEEETEAYNEMLGEKKCKPLVDVEEIEFKDVDLDDSGAIVPSELVTVGSLLCIPDSTVRDLFSDMDRDSDGQISHLEWRRAGEDTTYEYEVDRMADQMTVNKTKTRAPTPVTKAERAMKELLAEVHAPDFEALDTDGNGFLDEWEIMSGFMRVIMQRDPTMSREVRRHIVEVFAGGIDRLVLLLDTDADGLICPSEYTAAKVGHNLGSELKDLANSVLDSEERKKGLEQERRAPPGAAPAAAPPPAGGLLQALRRPRRRAAEVQGDLSHRLRLRSLAA